MQHYKFFYIFSLLFLLTLLAACGASNTEGTGGSNPAITTIMWDAPTTNVDGTPLSDLAGYRIYYGTSSNNYTAVIDAGNITTYAINDMAPATYYFAVTAYDTSGNESPFSNETIKTIP